jgi:hypothetical protein
MSIHQTTYEAFGAIESIAYDVGLVDYDDMTQQVRNLQCGLPISNCRITYSRAFTPLLYFLSPPVVYEDSEISFIIDPRNA